MIAASPPGGEMLPVPVDAPKPHVGEKLIDYATHANPGEHERPLSEPRLLAIGI